MNIINIVKTSIIKSGVINVFSKIKSKIKSKLNPERFNKLRNKFGKVFSKVKILGRKADNFLFLKQGRYEDRLFTRIVFIGFIALFISAIISWIQDARFMLRVFVQFSGSLLCFYLFYLSRFKQKKFIFTFNVIVVLMLSLLWFQTEGSKGTMVLYMFGHFIYSWFVLRGYKKWISTILHIGSMYILMAIEAFYPGMLIKRYETDLDRISSLMIHFLVFFPILTFLLRYKIKEFDIERSIFRKREEILLLNQKEEVTDDLTKLYNRKYIKKQIKNYIQHVEINPDSEHVIAFFDIDKFKDVNDTYGHIVGDEAIKGISSFFQISLKSTDLIARYAGDEFVIVMPNIRVIDAYHKLDDIRTQISELQWTSEAIKLTISVGVARIIPYNSADDAIKMADSAMYKAKEQGRNKVVYI